MEMEYETSKAGYNNLALLIVHTGVNRQKDKITFMNRRCINDKE